MRIRIANFKGRAPRIAPRLLPDGMAQIATVPRLLSGNLEAWKDNDLQFALAKKGSPYTDIINTIFPMDIDQSSSPPGPFWLHWKDSELGAGQTSVNVAKGPIVGDTNERIYLTGLDAPRWTDLSNATDPGNQGANPEFGYPYITYLLGVPAPTDAPVASIPGQDPSDPSGTVIPIVNGDAELDPSIGWQQVEVGSIGSLLRHESAGGASDPGPVIAYDGDFYFYGGTSAVTRAHQDIDMAVNNVLGGQAISLYYKTSTGSVGGSARMTIDFVDASNNNVGTASSTYPDPSAQWSSGWIDTVIPENATTIRLWIELTNAGTAGVDENDGYIDGITFRTKQFSYISSGDDLENWEINAQVGPTGNGTGQKRVFEYDAGGTNGLVFRFQSDEAVPWARKNFDLGTRSFNMTFDFLSGYRPEFFILPGATESGSGEGIALLQNRIEKRRFTGYDDRGVDGVSLVEGITYKETWCQMNIDGTRTDTGWTTTFTLTNLAANSTIAVGSTTLLGNGDFMLFKIWSHEGDDNNATVDIDNIVVSLSAPSSQDDTESSTSNYVFTYVNGNGEESGPSPVSNTITRAVDSTVTVTIVWNPEPDYDVQTWRLYRSVTGATGTIYALVNTDGDLPGTQTEYSDTKTDADLGEPLATELYATPPATANSIVATANGIVYMADGNQLIPSEQNVPHAYPVEYRLATDYPIVALGVMDTDVIIATQSHPYIAYGSTPDALVMAKLEKPQGCVSKRSLVTIADMGVLYASPDGLTLVRRNTVQVITERLMSRREWQNLNPSTIHAVEHDGRYIGFHSGTAGFIFDPNPDGFGWIDLDFYASAAVSNPLTDQLFLVIGGDLYVWDADAALRPYSWRSKQFKLPRPACFSAGDVRLVTGGTCTMKLYKDGAGSAFFTKSITAPGEFRMPAVACLDSIEIEFTGTATVEQVTIGEEMGEVVE